jgi:fatty-acyl-CoA synthase
VPGPGETVLRDVLRDGAAEDSGRPVYVAGDETVTLGELAERATARAAALKALSVGAGDRVAVVLDAGLAFIETFWALQLLGAAPCAFNPHVPSQTLERRIEGIRPALVITGDRATATSAAGARRADPDFGPENLAFLQLTSGTSGVPRASMITHANVMAYLRQSQRLGHIASGDVLVSWVPPWHDLGLVRFIIEPVFRRLRCHIVRPAVRTIGEWLTTISEVGGTISAAPDFAYRLACRWVDPRTVDLSTLRVCVNGGEPVRLSTVEEFERLFSLERVVTPSYGLGEATLGVAASGPGEELAVDARGNVACGRPMPGVEVRAGRSVDDPDEILVRSQTVFSGYFDAPDETALKLRDGWLHTGDSGYLDSEGRLFVLGRRAGMIKRGGALIAPRELEEAALRVEGVRVTAAASVGSPHGPGAETIVVAVETDRPESRPEAQIASAVSDQVVAALGFAPDRVLVVPPRTIPRTENGKIRHQRVAELMEATAF